MDSLGIDKGKRPLSDQSSRVEMNRDADRQMVMMNRPEKFCDEAGPSKSIELQLEEDALSAMSFTELLRDKSCLEKDQSNKLDEDVIRALISTPILSCRRGSQVPNLEFSLLPSSQSLDFFPATPNTPHQFKSPQQSPCHGFPILNWGGASPANVNGFRCSAESKQQQEQGQLTIFYGGTVNVYNVSTDMAKAIMKLASNGGNSKQGSTASTPTSFAPSTPVSSRTSPTQMPPIPSSSAVRSNETQPTFSLKAGKQVPSTLSQYHFYTVTYQILVIQEKQDIQPPNKWLVVVTVVAAANLPISRKNSLQRFLEKRNRRLYARAPYDPLHQN